MLVVRGSSDRCCFRVKVFLMGVMVTVICCL